MGATANHKPREYAVVDRNPGTWVNRILVGTPCTGLVRMEWVNARYGQIIPTNWSMAETIQWMSAYAPMRYMVHDAQNLIVKTCIEQDFEWCLFIEHDCLIPRDCFVRVNQYMRDCKIPVISGLYFTRSDPPEPLIFRGRGNSFYTDWKMGDVVWCDGVPAGLLLIHNSILKVLWEESAEYVVNNQLTRRVFSAPEIIWRDPERASCFNLEVGTSDLAFCNRLIEDKIFEKAGWPEFQNKRWPFPVDTRIFCQHIEMDGRQFPLGGIPKQFQREEKNGQVSANSSVRNRRAQRSRIASASS